MPASRVALAEEDERDTSFVDVSFFPGVRLAASEALGISGNVTSFLPASRLELSALPSVILPSFTPDPSRETSALPELLLAGISAFDASPELFSRLSRLAAFPELITGVLISLSSPRLPDVFAEPLPPVEPRCP